MRKSYAISGMHCESCTAKVEASLKRLENVTNVLVTLSPPKVEIDLLRDVTFDMLQDAVSSAGKYQLKEETNIGSKNETYSRSVENDGSLYPLFLIVGYILGVILISGFSSGNDDFSWIMRQFMAGFFITFSFFKLLDLEGFVSAFSGYDLIAKRFSAYAYSYPFIELLLGIAYLSGAILTTSYIITILLMGIGAIGVVNVLLRKDSIRCACLGTVLNLPMTKVTLIENLSMVMMAIIMLSK